MSAIRAGIVRRTHFDEESFEIHNVWRANRKQRRMEAMIATRIMEAADQA